MTFGSLWALLVVVLPVIASLLASLSSVDLAYHLRAGSMLFDSGVIPTTDTFTFTVSGEPWLNQQWGAQAVLAAVYRIAGWSGLAVVRAILVGAVTGLIFVACRRQGVAVRIAALLALVAFVLASFAMALRPQLFGMVLFALTLLLVVERRRHPALLWAVPVLVLVWANLHGSFFLGPAVLALAWLDDARDDRPGRHHALLVAVVAVVAACVNPFGPAVWSYAAGLSTNAGVTERITEWQPTSLRTPAGAAFFGSVLVVAAVLARRARPVPWAALAWLGSFFAIGAWAVRGAAWWPLAAAVALAGLLGTGFLGRGSAEPVTPEPVDRPRTANAVLAAACLVAAIALIPIWRPLDAALGAPAGVVGNAPSGITAALRAFARPGDRLYMPQPWGSWFELAVPDATVVLDSRFELFPEPVWTAYETVAAGRPGWTERLEAWGVTLVVATNDQAGGLLEQLRSNERWRAVHTDEDGWVFVRSDRPA